MICSPHSVIPICLGRPSNAAANHLTPPTHFFMGRVATCPNQNPTPPTPALIMSSHTIPSSTQHIDRRRYLVAATSCSISHTSLFNLLKPLCSFVHMASTLPSISLMTPSKPLNSCSISRRCSLILLNMVAFSCWVACNLEPSSPWACWR